jgi:MarR-like DNA-binding transcriptional regulator SgrR of sgrS sRNA
MTNYSEETRKKAQSFANALNEREVNVSLQITKADYINGDNLIVLKILLNDFVTEKKINAQFERWLRNKAISQTSLF